MTHKAPQSSNGCVLSFTFHLSQPTMMFSLLCTLTVHCEHAQNTAKEGKKIYILSTMKSVSWKSESA